MTGPTTTGSIDAKLGIDLDAFRRGAAEAKAEAKELGDLSPTVRVDANVGPALAKLDEVVALEKALEAQNVRLTATEKGLNQEQVNSTSGALRLATVEKMLGESRRAETIETGKAVEVTRTHTAETDKNAAAVNRGAQAQKQNISGVAVLISMAPALLAATAPIAASTVGLGAAFGVMGISGVLAIKGIKDAMVVGDTVGNTYATGIGVLKGNLDQLAANSANGMLAGFSTAVTDINSRMPFLNQLVREGSGLLGQMGSTALRGVLDGLQQMNPLIQQGGVELGRFVTWLFSFNGTNGFTGFLAYASSNLPSVMHLIENLVVTAGHILAAFAPLGPVVITALSAISDGLNNLPLPVLAGLVTTVTSLAPALNIARVAMDMAGTEAAIFGMKANLAVPVVGVLLAALSGLGLMAITAAQGTDHGTASVQNYTQALRDDTNSIGENVRAQAAKALVDSGAIDAARKLGVSIEDVTAAATGNGDALARVKTVTDAASSAVTRAKDAHQYASQAQRDQADTAKILTDTISGTNGAINDGIQKNKEYDATLAATKGGTDANTLAAQAQAQAYGTTVAALQAAKTAQEGHAQSAAAATLQMALEGDAAGLLKQAFDALNGKSLSLEQAQTRAASAANSATKSFQQNGTAINGTTDAAIANQQALQNKVAADQASAEATAKSTGSTEQGTAAYAGYKTALEDQLRAHGQLTPAVQAYLDKLYAVNDFKPVPTKLEVDKAQAETDLAAFKAYLDTVAGKRFTSYIDIITNRIETSTKDPAGTGSSTGGRANGSLAGGAATGGLIHAGFSASSPAYLSEGGSPFVPRGTDTVPAMLTPGEIVIKRASAQSLGTANLLEANRTGKWPDQGHQQAAQLPPIYVQNPFTGEYLLAQVDSRTSQAISAADNSSQYRRRGR
ncbi:hypothetical protein SAMN04487914_13250 [Arthrobacter sp. ok909]|uniref:hypothetical protein n=1 Tax=Arthrobacter sp. ok909 TaxID=1761746 RepID=UPI000892707E|nr:hypothetical protein [Arthrobacter sp. ok909]SDP74189.1 hypothetical protein SAMN04487914_13250 [Arthrobacter sp. ok909]